MNIIVIDDERTFDDMRKKGSGKHHKRKIKKIQKRREEREWRNEKE